MFPGTSAPWHLPVQLNLDPSRLEEGEVGKWGYRWENGMESEKLLLQ